MPIRAPRKTSESPRPSWLGLLHRPVPPERRTLNARRWQELPEDMRRPEQVLGRWHHACGATHGLHEGCNFACTSCYLSSSANAAPPLPQSEVLANAPRKEGEFFRVRAVLE